MGPWFSLTIAMIGLFSFELLAIAFICSVTTALACIENNLLKSIKQVYCFVIIGKCSAFIIFVWATSV